MPSQHNAASLPDNIWSGLLDGLADNQAVGRLRATCRAWRQDSDRALHSLSLVDPTVDHLKYASTTFPHLHTLQLHLLPSTHLGDAGYLEPNSRMLAEGPCKGCGGSSCSTLSQGPAEQDHLMVMRCLKSLAVTGVIDWRYAAAAHDPLGGARYPSISFTTSLASGISASLRSLTLSNITLEGLEGLQSCKMLQKASFTEVCFTHHHQQQQQQGHRQRSDSDCSSATLSSVSSGSTELMSIAGTAAGGGLMEALSELGQLEELSIYQVHTEVPPLTGLSSLRRLSKLSLTLPRPDLLPVVPELAPLSHQLKQLSLKGTERPVQVRSASVSSSLSSQASQGSSSSSSSSSASSALSAAPLPSLPAWELPFILQRLQAAGGMPALQALQVRGHTYVSDDCLHLISLTCPAINALDVSLAPDNLDGSAAPTVTSQGIASLQQYKPGQLRRLFLAHVPMTRCAVRAICGMDSLKELDLSGCEHVDDSTVYALCQTLGMQRSSLTYLSMADCPHITDISVAVLVKIMRALQHVDVSICTSSAAVARRVSDLGASCLAALPDLRSLNLHGRPISDKGLAEVISNRGHQLEQLSLAYCGAGITDATLELLACKSQSMTDIDVSGLPKITGQGVLKLESLRKLRRLSVNESGTSNGMSSCVRKASLEVCRAIVGWRLWRVCALQRGEGAGFKPADYAQQCMPWWLAPRSGSSGSMGYRQEA